MTYYYLILFKYNLYPLFNHDECYIFTSSWKTFPRPDHSCRWARHKIIRVSFGLIGFRCPELDLMSCTWIRVSILHARSTPFSDRPKIRHGVDHEDFRSNCMERKLFDVREVAFDRVIRVWCEQDNHMFECIVVFALWVLWFHDWDRCKVNHGRRIYMLQEAP